MECLRNTNCRIKKSDIDGVGVFAIKDIPKGTELFAGIPEKNYELFSLDEIRNCDPEVIDMVKGFFGAEQDGRYWIPEGGLNSMDISFFMNNASQPNTETSDGYTFYTARDIKKGEELTTHYASFDANHRENH